jgi:2-polyprenyl-3-methyl-5-hydroxy-6-metoxy-1,4-benzoquinol methylase
VGRDVIQSYAEASASLIPRYEKVKTAKIVASIAHLFPQEAANVLDLGAGTGRDAEWFAIKGHAVTAVEPVDAFRTAGAELHPHTRIRWVADALPGLDKTRAEGARYDVIWLNAVWHHLDASERHDTLVHLRDLIADTGRVFVSQRIGEVPVNQPAICLPIEQTVSCAARNGLICEFHEISSAVQKKNRKAGITWDWLSFRVRPHF